MTDTTTTPSYAATVNNRFYKSKSHYVSLQELITSISDPWEQKILTLGKTRFQKNFPNLTAWHMLGLCQSFPLPLDKILIDITLQRKYDVSHGCDIISGFSGHSVEAIRVYQDDMVPGYYVCWDGMHTASVLYMIASLMGEDLSKCVIPASLYQSTDKAIMRHNFIYLNSTGRKPLDTIDIYHQKIYAVRTDGSTNPDWLMANEKQISLENANMFVTNAKFNDTKLPGALSVMTEFASYNYDLSITQQFCKYFLAVCNSERPVAPKESWLLYDYFNACAFSEIDVTDDYIQELADSLNNAFGGTFDANVLYKRGLESYEIWYLTMFSADNTLRGITRNEKKIGATYLNAVLQQYFIGPVPTINEGWPVDPSDIY